MSTQAQPPRMSAKTAAKRRAAARRRNREWRQRFFAIFFVGIFILGTATTAFIFSNQQASVSTDTSTPVAQESPTGASLAIDQLEKNGDDYVAKNDLDGAISSYSAAAALDQQNAQLQYKIGNILIQQQKYTEAAAHLSRASELDPSGTPGAQARSLMDQYKNVLPTSVVGTPVLGMQGTITNTSAITATAPVTNSNSVSPTQASPNK